MCTKDNNHHSYNKFSIRNDLTGKKINHLTVIEFAYNKRLKCGKNQKYWKCVCDCGNECFIQSNSLMMGKTKSCGCLYKSRFKGGKIDVHGYRMIYCPKVKKYVQEHRLNYENHYGVKLGKHNNIHHINGDRLDNRIENLELWDTSQPKGQRVEDKIKFYFELSNEYRDHPQYKNLFDGEQ